VATKVEVILSKVVNRVAMQLREVSMATKVHRARVHRVIKVHRARVHRVIKVHREIKVHRVIKVHGVSHNLNKEELKEVNVLQFKVETHHGISLSRVDMQVSLNRVVTVVNKEEPKVVNLNRAATVVNKEEPKVVSKFNQLRVEISGASISRVDMEANHNRVPVLNMEELRVANGDSSSQVLREVNILKILLEQVSGELKVKQVVTQVKDNISLTK
jgi:hypothetical protein